MTQIRGGAPAAERAFFGVGPVQVGVPLREGTDDRMRSYVDAADLATQDDTLTVSPRWRSRPTRSPSRPTRRRCPTEMWW